jgi:hypothetical protein
MTTPSTLLVEEYVKNLWSSTIEQKKKEKKERKKEKKEKNSC